MIDTKITKRLLEHGTSAPQLIADECIARGKEEYPEDIVCAYAYAYGRLSVFLTDALEQLLRCDEIQNQQENENTNSD